MTHVSEVRSIPVSPRSKVTRDIPFCVPVTVIEFPVLKILGCRTYQRGYDRSLKAHREFLRAKSQTVPEDVKGHSLRVIADIDYRSMKSLPTKKNRRIELGLSGSFDDQVTFYQGLGENVDVSSFLKTGQYVDISGITRGLGFAGVVRRMGVKLLDHKNSKKRRGIGTLGSFNPGRVLSTVPREGQLGSFQRTSYNSRVMAISDDPSQVNPAGGFLKYGFVHSTFALLEGSVPSVAKGTIFLRRQSRPIRRTKIFRSEVIDYISRTSKQ
jgi:large subunit ribosomal protein L3